MPKKNNPTPKNSINDNKPSKASKRKSLSAAIMMTAGALSTNLAYNQTPDSSLLKETSKKQTERVEKNDSIEHEKIIQTKIDTLFAQYGKEKGMEIIREHILIEINHQREIQNQKFIMAGSSSQALPMLTRDSLLDIAAQNHAEDMDRNNYLSHTNQQGQNAEKRIRQTGYALSKVGENIAAGPSTIAGVLSFRMGSNGHRYNILYTDYLNLGVGLKNDVWVITLGGTSKK